MRVDELPDFLKAHWLESKAQLLQGTYQPQGIKRVEIPKPGSQAKRQLGIPGVRDRLIQQAVLQVLQPRWDATFSESSYGFRPGRSAHQAVAQAQSYLQQGYEYVVDIDLEKFFYQVCHDRLMSKLAVGDRAPDFELEGTGSRTYGLEDYRGTGVILAFYPGDFTPVCTKQFCSYRDDGDRIEGLGMPMLGISPQSVESHERFAADVNAFLDG